MYIGRWNYYNLGRGRLLGSKFCFFSIFYPHHSLISFFDQFFSILGPFLIPRILNFGALACTGAQFLQIWHFWRYCKNWFKIPGFGARKSIENSRNFENKTSLNTSLFLTLIFFDFLSILTPKLASNGVSFLRVFFKMGPKGAQEAPRGLQEVILREFGFHCGRFLASFFRSCWIFPEYFWASGLAFVPVHMLSCFP